LESTPAQGVRVLAFNRPTKLNALSQELIREFLDKLSTAAADARIKTIVVTGSSSFFCGRSRSP
jgi:enoyl-CoA hydratase